MSGSRVSNACSASWSEACPTLRRCATSVRRSIWTRFASSGAKRRRSSAGRVRCSPRSAAKARGSITGRRWPRSPRSTSRTASTRRPARPFSATSEPTRRARGRGSRCCGLANATSSWAIRRPRLQPIWKPRRRTPGCRSHASSDTSTLPAHTSSRASSRRRSSSIGGHSTDGTRCSGCATRPTSGDHRTPTIPSFRQPTSPR